LSNAHRLQKRSRNHCESVVYFKLCWPLQTNSPVHHIRLTLDKIDNLRSWFCMFIDGPPNWWHRCVKTSIYLHPVCVLRTESLLTDPTVFTVSVTDSLMSHYMLTALRFSGFTHVLFILSMHILVNLEEFTSWQELNRFGLEKLKQELLSRGLKCGGSLEQRAQRLFR